MYLGSHVNVYTRIQNLTFQPKARTVKLYPSIKSLIVEGTYDTLSEIGKRKREFICRGAEVKLRLIVLRTCTCVVISHLYRNKLDVAERGEEGPGGEGPGGRSGGRGPSPGSSGRAPFGGFLWRSSWYNKVKFYCRSAGRE